MNIDKMSATMERYVMPVAEKFGNERHLQAIRDAFMSLLPITFTGGIAAVLNSAPSVDHCLTCCFMPLPISTLHSL